MLAKKHRLPAKISTKHFLTFSEDFFSLRVGENKTKDSRFGFVVSKSVDKRAVVRNRLKRQFRRFIEENYSKIKPGYDFLFKLKPVVKGQSTKDINIKIKEGLEKKSLIE